MEKLYEAIGTVIGALIIFVISSPILQKIKNYRVRNKFGSRMDADASINKILSDIKSAYGFNSACLIEYHNGTTSLSGFGFKNATMTHESVDDGTKPLILEFKNIPTSLASSMLAELEKSTKGYVIGGEDHPDEAIRITNRMFNITQSWNFRIGASLVDGCLGLNSINGTVDLSDNDILDIKAKCQKILLIKRNAKP